MKEYYSHNCGRYRNNTFLVKKTLISEIEYKIEAKFQKLTVVGQFRSGSLDEDIIFFVQAFTQETNLF